MRLTSVIPVRVEADGGSWRKRLRYVIEVSGGVGGGEVWWVEKTFGELWELRNALVSEFLYVSAESTERDLYEFLEWFPAPSSVQAVASFFGVLNEQFYLERLHVLGAFLKILISRPLLNSSPLVQDFFEVNDSTPLVPRPRSTTSIVASVVGSVSDLGSVYGDDFGYVDNNSNYGSGGGGGAVAGRVNSGGAAGVHGGQYNTYGGGGFGGGRGPIPGPYGDGPPSRARTNSFTRGRSGSDVSVVSAASTTPSTVFGGGSIYGSDDEDDGDVGEFRGMGSTSNAAALAHQSRSRAGSGASAVSSAGSLSPSSGIPVGGQDSMAIPATYRDPETRGLASSLPTTDIGTVREAHRPSTPPGPSAEDLAVLKYEAGELPPVRFTARTDSFTTVQRFREIVKATDEEFKADKDAPWVVDSSLSLKKSAEPATLLREGIALHMQFIAAHGDDAGKIHLAILHYKKSLKNVTRDRVTHSNLGVALCNVAVYKFFRNEIDPRVDRCFDLACASFERSLQAPNKTDDGFRENRELTENQVKFNWALARLDWARLKPQGDRAAGTLAAASETLQEIVGDDPLFYEAAFQLGMSVVIQSTLRKISANQRIQILHHAREFFLTLSGRPLGESTDRRYLFLWIDVLARLPDSLNKKNWGDVKSGILQIAEMYDNIRNHFVHLIVETTPRPEYYTALHRLFRDQGSIPHYDGGQTEAWCQERASECREVAAFARAPSQPFVHVGWLFKKGANFQNWKRRVFLLSRDRLIYTDTLGRLSSPKGTIMLRDVRRVEAATDNKKTEKALNAPTGASFNIVTDKRTYKCVANSIADRDAWLDIIEATKMGSRREWARAVGGGLPALSGMDDAFGGGSSAASTSTAGPSEAVAAATAAEAAADGFEFVEREVEHHPALLNPYSYFVLI